MREVGEHRSEPQVVREGHVSLWLKLNSSWVRNMRVLSLADTHLLPGLRDHLRRGDGDLSPVSILSLCGEVAQSAMFVTEVLRATQMTPGTVRLDITHSVPPSLLPLFPFLSP